MGFTSTFKLREKILKSLQILKNVLFVIFNWVSVIDHFGYVEVVTKVLKSFIYFVPDPIVEPPTTPTSDSFGIGDKSPSSSSNSQSATDSTILNSNSNGAESNVSEYGSIPGAEPTPPPEPSPDYPKIRIKTTGLLKEPEGGLTITEITDDNPDGDPNFSK